METHVTENFQKYTPFDIVVLFLEMKIWKPHPKIEIMLELNDSLSTFRKAYPVVIW